MQNEPKDTQQHLDDDSCSWVQHYNPTMNPIATKLNLKLGQLNITRQLSNVITRIHWC